MRASRSKCINTIRDLSKAVKLDYVHHMDALPTSSSGAIAARNGRQFENAIVDMLLHANPRIADENGIAVAEQVLTGPSIYGTPLRCDILVEGLRAYPQGLAIEAKWQSSAGSVDEKFPFLVENIRSGCYGRPVLIVLDGQGYRSGAAEWLTLQADGINIVDVLTLDELRNWLNAL